MKVVIDTKMERHMLETTSDDALAVTQRIMEKYAEEAPFLMLWDEKENKTVTLRKSEIMAIFVYPDELHDYDKTTIDMIQDAVIQKEKESYKEETDFDVEIHFKDGSVVKAYTDEDGRMIFKPQGKGAKEDEGSGVEAWAHEREKLYRFLRRENSRVSAPVPHGIGYRRRNCVP